MSSKGECVDIITGDGESGCFNSFVISFSDINFVVNFHKKRFKFGLDINSSLPAYAFEGYFFVSLFLRCLGGNCTL